MNILDTRGRGGFHLITLFFNFSYVRLLQSYLIYFVYYSSFLCYVFVNFWVAMALAYFFCQAMSPFFPEKKIHREKIYMTIVHRVVECRGQENGLRTKHDSTPGQFFILD